MATPYKGPTGKEINSKRVKDLRGITNDKLELEDVLKIFYGRVK